MAEMSVNGVRLHVQRLGSGGPPVVFLHGLVMDNLSSWYFTAGNKLAAAADVILFDLRGHGLSQRPPSGYAVTDFVADLHGLLAAAGVGAPVALVGNSFGGLLAVAFAHAYPERVARMALIDGLLPAAGWAESMAATLSLEGSARDNKISESFRSWLGRHSERKRNRLAANARALVYETTLLEDLRRSPVLSEADLRTIDCPVLALYGELSDVRAGGERLSMLLPRCELRLLPGGSHSILWEATARVCGDLADWIGGTPVENPPPAGRVARQRRGGSEAEADVVE